LNFLYWFWNGTHQLLVCSDVKACYTDWETVAKKLNKDTSDPKERQKTLWRHNGNVEVKLHAFLKKSTRSKVDPVTRHYAMKAYRECGGKGPHILRFGSSVGEWSAAWLLEYDPQDPLDRRLGGPRSWSGCGGSAPARNWTMVIWPIVRHFTDWAIPASPKDMLLSKQTLTLLSKEINKRKLSLSSDRRNRIAEWESRNKKFDFIWVASLGVKAH
jgi:hypothetical protein